MKYCAEYYCLEFIVAILTNIALSSSAAFILLLFLKPAIYMSFSRSLFQLFFVLQCTL